MDDKIFGYSWERIKSAQQGGSLQEPLKGPPTKPQATDDDLKALAKHGVAGLKALGYFGILDRLGKL